MADFDKCLAHVLKHEGGYANVKGDKGGETYCGISRRYWPSWPGWPLVDQAKPLKYNQIINSRALADLVKTFYRENFWQKIAGDQIQSGPAACLLFDWFVNSGGWAIRAIQAITGQTGDGVIGRNTLAAINAAEPRPLFDQLKAARIAFVNNIVKSNPSQKKFLAGWLVRIEHFNYED